MVGIDSCLCEGDDGVIVMSDETTAELVEQVRSRYAEAARAVLNRQGDPD
jgi:hypothetical protein